MAITIGDCLSWLFCLCIVLNISPSSSLTRPRSTKFFSKIDLIGFFFTLYTHRECRLLVLIQITSSCFDWHSLLLSTFWWVTSQTKFLVISFQLLHLISSQCIGTLDLNFQIIFILAFSAVSFGKSWGREQDTTGIFRGNLILLQVHCYRLVTLNSIHTT